MVVYKHPVSQNKREKVAQALRHKGNVETAQRVEKKVIICCSPEFKN
jgi:hypothetical protein